MNEIKNLKIYKKVLIVVDMVNGFVREGVLHDENIAEVIPRQIELIKEHSKEIPIFRSANMSLDINLMAASNSPAECTSKSIELTAIRSIVSVVSLLMDKYSLSVIHPIRSLNKW